MEAANILGYPLGFGTTGGSDTGRNSCGIATGHAYSIIDVFQLTANGVTTNMLLSRNPWGSTDYSAVYYHGDARWTADLIS